ncbi:hypothetical protein FA95DRAFT_1558346 [Auriscalpium vulgare]|uniref:Uncharacterized protein n=1 Tax=Auriscalpium vulgare TaxID=40419 RepID=A0ACB8RWA6_9AGAM|nr:hypothetical protein FA95DRAFT_1558346 [Auriscalpium vulgare]
MPASGTLPIEILLMIVQHVPSANDLRSLRSVNKDFCNAATPAAFRTVGATNRRDSALGLVNLLESGLAKYVQEAIYRDAAADENGHIVVAADQDAGYGPTVEGTIVHAFSLGARLPSLLSLRFTFHPIFPMTFPPPVYPCERYEALHFQVALLLTVGGAAPRLRSLTLSNVTVSGADYLAAYESPAFYSALLSLTHLRIRTAAATSVAESPSFRHIQFTGSWIFMTHTSMLSSAENLVSLTLETDIPLISTPFDWDRVTLPRLKYLAFISPGVTVGGEVGQLESFTERHDQLEWIDFGVDKVPWVRRTHADPEDVSEYEIPPSVALTQAGK